MEIEPSLPLVGSIPRPRIIFAKFVFNFLGDGLSTGISMLCLTITDLLETSTDSEKGQALKYNLHRTVTSLIYELFEEE